MILRRLAFVVCILGCLEIQGALGCRFTVRETGFVDLGYDPYFLYCYVKSDGKPDVGSILEEAAQEELAESNVRFELINADEQQDDPAMKHLDLSRGVSFPALVLVSPDGQSLGLRTGGVQPFAEGFRSAVREVLSSPKRREIVRQCIDTYAVLLLIEGPDEEENKLAREAAAAAVERVGAEMEFLPKPVSHPPALVVVDSNSLADEKVLLWSLGLEAGQVDAPHAAILYGRARWMGPLFKGEQITEDNLAAILFVVGDTCECGLDRRWLQGTMLPAAWGRELQELVAKNLGYDPENPMVKMEIGSILGRGGASYPGVGYGYQELVIEPEPNAALEAVAPEEANVVEEPESAGAQETPANPGEVDIYRPIGVMAFGAIGLTAIIAVVGIAVAVRRRRI
ncbi:MAG: hypothetical protein JSU94_07190 [Phycisphaerales bacterium]|nr:MAG: hypothetical protein JSU94_07190 [Phycisphaerales bacterium]